MSDVQTPLFIRLGARSHPARQALRNVIISNIIARSDGPIGSSITGVPGAAAQNIKLAHLLFECPGLGTAEMARRDVPENARGYPENRMFGPSLPAYGLYVRHVENLTLDDVQFRLLKPDERPALVFDDVRGIRLTNSDADAPSGGGAALTFDHAAGVYVQGCAVGDSQRTFVLSSQSELNGVRLGKQDFAAPPGSH